MVVFGTHFPYFYPVRLRIFNSFTIYIQINNYMYTNTRQFFTALRNILIKYRTLIRIHLSRHGYGLLFGVNIDVN